MWLLSVFDWHRFGESFDRLRSLIGHHRLVGECFRLLVQSLGGGFGLAMENYWVVRFLWRLSTGAGETS